MKTVHEETKDHKCVYCQKRFGLKNNLKLHIKTVHEKIKDNKCDFCNKSFGHRTHLKRHVRTVHENMKYASVNPDVTKVLDKKQT